MGVEGFLPYIITMTFATYHHPRSYNYNSITDMINSPKFVGWAAVSSQSQASDDKISLADQIHQNVMAVRQHGGVLVCHLIVPGESRYITLFEDAATTVVGWKLAETFSEYKDESLMDAIESTLRDIHKVGESIFVYAEFKKLVDSQSFDVLAFRNLGRIGRDAALSLTAMRLCHRADIITYSTASPPQSLDEAAGSYHASLVDAITAVGYENEIHELKERHRTGITRRVNRGMMPGRVPFGYKALRDEKGKIVNYEIDEPAAEIVRQIFDMYLNHGLGAISIAEELHKEGFTTPEGAVWNHASIYNILKRQWIYAGYAEVNKSSKRRKYLRVRGKWEPIISETVAREVIKERESRLHAPRSISHSRRFSRMVFCSVCGKRGHAIAVIVKRKPKNREEYIYKSTSYRCPGHCAISEKKVIHAMRGVLDDFNIMTAEDIIAEPETKIDTDAINSRIDTVQQQIARTTDGISRADADYYIAGKMDEQRHRAITEAATQRLEELHAELTTLQESLTQIESTIITPETIDEIKQHGYAMLDEPDPQVANAWLRRFFVIYIAPGGVVADVEIKRS